MMEAELEAGGASKIENKALLLKCWRAELADMKKLAADKSLYVRVLGNGYRLISISPGNPCGRLIRRGTGTVIGSTSRMAGAIKHAETAEAADFYPPKTKNGKPEHRMQAAMIRHALTNDLNLHGLFEGFTDVFDELLFVTDELATEVAGKKIRADIVALGGMRGKYFPVFIELKATRALTRLLQQLKEAKEAMEEAGDDFALLLSSATGKPCEDIRLDDARLLIVWTGSDTGQERSAVGKARADRFLVSNYDEPRQRIVRSHGAQ